MILFPLNGESIRKCVWGNNLLVRSDHICGDTETRCLPYFRPGGAQIWRPQISVTHVEEQLSSGKLHRSETQPGC